MSESEKKFKCLACGEIVAYGKHCSKVPNGDLTKDKKHQKVASEKGILYAEVK